MKKIFGMTEGLENLLIKSARTAKNFSEFVNFMTSRRYQTSRIKRLILYFLMDLTTEKILEIQKADYIRPLAFNERGQKLLKKFRQISKIPIVDKISKHLNRREIERGKIFEPYKKNIAVDIAATNFYKILFDEPKIFRI